MNVSDKKKLKGFENRLETFETAGTFVTIFQDHVNSKRHTCTSHFAKSQLKSLAKFKYPINVHRKIPTMDLEVNFPCNYHQLDS